MSYLRRFAYMGLGALLVLSLVVGGMVAFAQDDVEEDNPALQEDDAETTEDEAQQDDEEAESILPGRGFRAERPDLGDEDELLAEALGITVAELEAAEDDAFAAAIEQALAEELITEEQAEALQEQGSGRWFPRGLDIDKDDLLAEALGISAEELETAKAEVRAARLAAMVEAGALTQEEADLMVAREAVQSYLDQEALAETVQNAYEEAVAAALAAGAITQEQADQLLESFSTFEFRFDRFGLGGGGHHGGRHHRPPGLFAPGAGTEAPALEGTAGA